MKNYRLKILITVFALAIILAVANFVIAQDEDAATPNGVTEGRIHAGSPLAPECYRCRTPALHAGSARCTRLDEALLRRVQLEPRGHRRGGAVRRRRLHHVRDVVQLLPGCDRHGAADGDHCQRRGLDRKRVHHQADATRRHGVYRHDLRALDRYRPPLRS